MHSVKLIGEEMEFSTDLEPSLLQQAVPTLTEIGPDRYRVPFSDEAAYALNRLGIRVPSPMTLYYDFPMAYGKKAYRHQIAGAAFLATTWRGYVLAEPGTGKTMMAAWALDYLLKNGFIRRALVVTPKSTLVSAWVNDLSANLPKLPWTVLATSRRKRAFAMRSKKPLHIINHEGVGLFWEDLAVNEYDLIVYDESTKLKNPSTQVHQGMRNLKLTLGADTRVWQMTGTPTAQSPEDAYGQILIAANVNDEGRHSPPYPVIGNRFMSASRWRSMTMRRIFPANAERSIWEPLSNAEETVHRFMQPAYSVRLRDCVDLPPEILLPAHSLPYSADQKKALKDLRDEGQHVAEGKAVTTTMAAALLSKVMQVGCGILYTDPDFVPMPGDEAGDIEGRPYLEFSTKAKDAEMIEMLEQAEGKAIVYVPFTAALKRVSKFLRANGLKVAEVYGSLGPQALANRVKDFQDQRGKTDVIVAQPYKMSHGITATAASLTLWYGPILRGEVYQQANKRMARIGQTRTQIIGRLAHPGTEVYRFRQLDEKTARQERLLELYKLFMNTRGESDE